MKVLKAVIVGSVLVTSVGCGQVSNMLSTKVAMAEGFAGPASSVDDNGVTIPKGPVETTVIPKEAEESKVSSWAEEDVNWMIKNGFVPSYLQSRYTSNITREEYADLVLKVLNKLSPDWWNINSIQSEKEFSDSTSPNVLLAYSLGIVNGTTDETFEPKRNIERQAAAVMMANMLKSINAKNLSTEESDFADRLAIASWAQDSVNISFNAKIFQGSDLGFRAYDYYTIEQSIITMKRLVDFVEKVDYVTLRGKVILPISSLTKNNGNSPKSAFANSLFPKVGNDYVKLGKESDLSNLNDYVDLLSIIVSSTSISKIKSGENKVVDNDFTVETGGSDYVIKISW